MLTNFKYCINQNLFPMIRLNKKTDIFFLILFNLLLSFCSNEIKSKYLPYYNNSEENISSFLNIRKDQKNYSAHSKINLFLNHKTDEMSQLKIDPILSKIEILSSQEVVSKINNSLLMFLDEHTIKNQVKNIERKLFSPNTHVTNFNEIPISSNNNFPSSSQTSEENQNDYHLFAKTKYLCNSSNCPYPNACTDAFVCKCSREYANFFSDPVEEFNPIQYCSYKRKKQLTAFLLEFFLGQVAAGHWYTGQYIIGAFKVFGFILYLGACSNIDKNEGLAIILVLFFIWLLVDWILYGINIYKDQNKVALVGF
jgi:hypothetical protein